MRIVFFTGAGMSAESGVPTFRDALTGLWSRFDPEQLATEAAFRRDPALVWGWYRWRASQVRNARPHAGHLTISELERAGHDIAVVTQNVDDLHERAGSSRVLHLHGSLYASRCIDCAAGCAEEPMHAPLPADLSGDASMPPPHCTHCGGHLRPGVVWFGEPLPDDAWAQAQAAIRDAELIVVVGTSGLVFPAAGLPLQAAQAGRRVIEINPQRSEWSAHFSDSWRMPGSSGMTRLRDALAGGQS